jgi:hypothetical protein
VSGADLPRCRALRIKGQTDIDSILRRLPLPGSAVGGIAAGLARTRLGEHWARHWLDVAHFAETRGYEWNFEVLGDWRHRDYVVRNFNADVPAKTIASSRSRRPAWVTGSPLGRRTA